MSKTCPSCGSPLKDNAKFCDKCGCSIVETQNVTKQNTISEYTESDDNIRQPVKKQSSSNIVKIGAGVAVAAVILFGGLSLMGKNDGKESKTATSTPPVTQQQTKSADISAPAATVAPKPAETITANRPIKIMRASATSFLKEPNQTYPASQAVDGDIKTCWVEGHPGYGINEGLYLEFDDVYELHGFNIWTGYQKSEDLFYKNCRPISVLVRSEGGGGAGYKEIHELKDAMGRQTINLKRSFKARTIMITIMKVAPGSKFEDTCISEVSIF